MHEVAPFLPGRIGPESASETARVPIAFDRDSVGASIHAAESGALLR
jgi:hypothetical protein